MDLDLQTPSIFWPFWLFTNYGRSRLAFWGIVIQNWNAQKPRKLQHFECFNIFLPSPAHVSSISWGCTIVHCGWACGSDSGTHPTSSCSKHFCTESAKTRNPTKTPGKHPAKNPQNARKGPQIQKTGCLVCFCTRYTIPSFVVVFARHRDLKKVK